MMMTDDDDNDDDNDDNRQWRMINDYPMIYDHIDDANLTGFSSMSIALIFINFYEWWSMMMMMTMTMTMNINDDKNDEHQTSF